MVALAEAGDRRVDGDHEPGEAGDARALDRALGGGPPADQVELVEHRGRRGRLHVLEPMAGDRREDAPGAGRAGGARGGHLALGVHHPQVADGRQHERQRQIAPEHARTQVARRHRHRLAGAKRQVVEGPAVLAKRHLAIGAAVDVVEHRTGHPPARERPQIVDADDARRGDAAFGSRHASLRREAAAR